MSKFAYSVQDGQGTTSKGVLEAPDEEQAVLALQNKGYFIFSIQPAAAGSGAGGRKLGRLLAAGGGKISGRNLQFFAEQLATLLNGGVPIVRALSLLGEHTENRALGHLVAQVNKDVAGGGALYRAFEKYPGVFPPIWIALTQAGEVSGQLPMALKQLSAYIGAQEDLKGKILTALLYPAVLLLMSVGVLTFFILKIVPVFAEVFSSFDVKLPALTQFILSFSMFVTHHIIFIVVLIVGAAFFVKGWLSTGAGRYAWNQIQMRLPIFGSFAKNIQMERFLTTLSTLIQSGVSILNALSVLEGVFTENLVVLKALRAAKNDVATGKSISASFRSTGVFPGLVTEMMWMGEESGKLAEIMGTLSVFYREQVEQFIRRFTSIIDPILVVMVGGVIGVIVLSVFMPIFQLAQIGTK